MEYEEARQFWDTVAKREKPENLHVGQVLWLEDMFTDKGNRAIVVTSKELNDDGNFRIVFRDAEPDEVDEDTVLTVMVAGVRWQDSP